MEQINDVVVYRDIEGPAKIHNAHISVLYILRSQVQVQCHIDVISGLLAIYG